MEDITKPEITPETTNDVSTEQPKTHSSYIKRNWKLIYRCVLIVIVIGWIAYGGIYYFFLSKPTKQAAPFQTQKECEDKTGKKCSLNMCQESVGSPQSTGWCKPGFYPYENSSPTTTVQSTISSETSNWKMYENRIYGFSFKYPNKYYWLTQSKTNIPSYSYSPDEGIYAQISTTYCNYEEMNWLNCGSLSPDQFTISGYENKQKWDLKTWLQKSIHSPLKLDTCTTKDPRTTQTTQRFLGQDVLVLEYTVDSQTWYGKHCPKEQIPLDYSVRKTKKIILKYGNSILIPEIGYFHDEGKRTPQPELEQILSSLKLISSDRNLIGWHQYYSSELGLSFAYPSTFIYTNDRSGEMKELPLFLTIASSDPSKRTESTQQYYQIDVTAYRNHTLNEYYKNQTSALQAWQYEPVQNITVAGEKAIRIGALGSGKLIPTVWLEHDKILYEVKFNTSNDGNVGLFDQILSTFKFTSS